MKRSQLRLLRRHSWKVRGHAVFGMPASRAARNGAAGGGRPESADSRGSQARWNRRPGLWKAISVPSGRVKRTTCGQRIHCCFLDVIRGCARVEVFGELLYRYHVCS